MFKNYLKFIPDDVIPSYAKNKKYTFATDNICHPKKPTKDSKIWNVIYKEISKHNTDGSIIDITNRILNGQTIAPGHFHQTKSNLNFICAQSIFIDVDGKTSVMQKEQAIDMLNQVGINVNICYDSFSYLDPKHPKYRLVILLDKIIAGGDHYKYLLEGIKFLFAPYIVDKTIDPCLTSISQHYLGTQVNQLNIKIPSINNFFSYQVQELPDNIKECSILCFEPNRYELIKELADASKYDNKYGYRKVKSFDNQTISQITNEEFMGVNNTQTDSYKDFVKKVENDHMDYYIYYSRCGKSPQNQSNPYKCLNISSSESDLNLNTSFPLLRGVRLDQLCSIINILGDVQKRELRFLELRGILLNLQFIEGGYKYIYDVMRSNDASGLTDYKEKDYLLFKTLKTNKYAPQHLENFSPYVEDFHYRSIYEAAKLLKMSVIRHNTPENKTLQEAQEWLTDTLERAINSKNTDLHLIIVPTGVGKSEYIARNFTGLKGCEVCFPTHKLVDEIEQRILIHNPTLPASFYLKTKPLPSFTNNQIDKAINELLQNNDIEALKKFLQVLAFPIEPNMKSELYYPIIGAKMNASVDNQLKQQLATDMESARKYLSHIDEIIKYNGNVLLTTHAKGHLMNNLTNFNTKIFDEDFLNSGFRMHTISLKNINKLIKTFPDLKPQLLCLVNDINNNEQYYFKNTAKFSKKHVNNLIQKEKRMRVRSALVSLLRFSNSGYYLAKNNEIKFLSSPKLSDRKKYIILTATANVELYRGLAEVSNKKLHIYNDVEHVMHKGQIIQHMNTSFSMQSLGKILRENPSRMPEIPEGYVIVTFQRYIKQLQEYYTNHTVIDEIHLFNNLGYDSLNGKNIAIIGKPTINPDALVLQGLECGLDIKINDPALLQCQNQTIRTENLEYGNYYTFTNDTLRRLSLEYTDAVLTQCVGRARTQRNECTVELYCNYPLEEATTFVY